MRTAQARLKQVLTSLGARVPERWLLNARITLNYMQLGRWMRDHGFHGGRRLPTRERCFDLVAHEVGDRPVLYLEFGVYRGDSLRYWARILKHPDSRLIGFDSFQGLPETFDERSRIDRRRFDLDGVMPHFADPRIQLYKGWFDEVLPGFAPPPHEQLIIGLDADLYSSTISVLRHMDKWVVPGTFLYFDDLAHIGHETLAFHEYVSDTGKQFELFAAETTLNRCVFRCVEYGAEAGRPGQVAESSDITSIRPAE